MRGRGSDNPNPPKRSELRPGIMVWCIEKENYGTSRYTQGMIRDILSPGAAHPRGVKVRLTDGTICRVQWVMEEDDEGD